MFPVPKHDTDSLAVSPTELSLLLEGVDISSLRLMKRKPRFSLAEIP
jgi:hypothetical protein